MSGNQEKPSFNMKDMEKWLENYFLDPLTNYLDETTFRVDIFETEKEYILEALLTDFKPEDVTVFLKDCEIQIKAKPSINAHSETAYLARSIQLPFIVTDKHVHATFIEGILEVFISKEKPGFGNNQFVTIS
ncbi:Hsp20/alpha crystallin family protein [Cytobacillus sp. FJAT-54145]|uniref:Hsp20/alpha crystallin family protein n=1 Tax=Cytobacillus spartinae TaxID=3299023 RepID=A0ABW6K544_9BACI